MAIRGADVEQLRALSRTIADAAVKLDQVSRQARNELNAVVRGRNEASRLLQPNADYPVSLALLAVSLGMDAAELSAAPHDTTSWEIGYEICPAGCRTRPRYLWP